MSTQTTMWHIRSWALLGPEPMPWHVRSWRKQTFEKQILGTPRPDQNSHARYTQREPEISLNYECNHQQPYATQRTAKLTIQVSRNIGDPGCYATMGAGGYLDCPTAPNAGLESKKLFPGLSNQARPPDPQSTSPAIWENGRAQENDELGGLITDENKPAAENKENKQVRACENCGNLFEARAGNGGRPQKFCAPACRREFHCRHAASHPEQSQRSAPNVPTVAPTSDTWEPAPQNDDSDFDWTKNAESIVLASQEQTAIYFNQSGGLVVRQYRWPDDDVFIVVSKNNIPEFLNKLTDACGIVSFP
jgi:hypothetical protein